MKETKYQKPIKKGSGKAVFVDGVRTPFVKSFGVFKDCDTLDLFSSVVDGIIRKTDIDPNEIDDLADDKSYAEKISELKSEILKIADPKKINKNAFKDQEAMIRRLGGREAILAAENFDHTPV